MVVAYDLDGVLATKPILNNPKRWGRMTGVERAAHRVALLAWYEDARPLHIPTEPHFYIITARRAQPEVIAITVDWLLRHGLEVGDRCLGIFFLEQARSIRAVLAFKAAKLLELGVTDFYEDNHTIVKGLIPMVAPYCRIHLLEPEVHDATTN